MIDNPRLPPEDDQIRADWSKLTDKQQQLIKLYMKTGNKLGSYQKVYNVTKGTRSAKQNAYAEFRKPHIKAIIEQIQTKAIAKAKLSENDIRDESIEDLIKAQKDVEALQIDALWVLKRAALLASFNIRKFLEVDANGNAVYNFKEATDDDWYCINEYTVDQIDRADNEEENVYLVERIKLKAYDKIRALELVARFLPDDGNKNPLDALASAFKDAFNANSRIDVDASLDS